MMFHRHDNQPYRAPAMAARPSCWLALPCNWAKKAKQFSILACLRGSDPEVRT